MSVAFRRDCDEEHLEPKFERPIPPGPNLVTAAGLTQIEARVSALETVVASESDEARLAEAKRDLRYWHNRLRTAQLAPSPSGDKVGFGSWVRFRLRGGEQTLHIVGDDEADPAHGRIAFSAPLARAMMGATVGEQVDFVGEPEAIEVLEIKHDDPGL
jgi:transcription elongation GreA/GreB family factor